MKSLGLLCLAALSATSPVSSSDLARIQIETKSSLSTTLRVYLYNWATGIYGQIGSNISVGTADGFFEVKTSGSPGSGTPYIRPSDKRMKARLEWTHGTSSFNAFADVIEVGVR